MTNKKQLGKEGELRFAAEFIRQGWNIFLPYGEDSEIDLLLQKGAEYKRVQIKSTRSKEGIIHGRIKSSNNWQIKKYSKEIIDWFGIYDAITKEGYLVPIEKVEGKTEIYLRINKPKNNQKKDIRMASEYKYF
ncbi:MAG TPA: group I intron-associated PD-(D/E)XK endonuclease [Candidatus Nanoarchaeia archaeon]|nr:group I intron-associated PD-(D/E)XK endonuclease [Candidatus Nanoarchaeia archaeon]